DLRWDVGAQGLEEGELGLARQARGGELGAFEIAVDALIEAEHDGAVQALEIEGVVEGAPHARILEFLQARVEGEGLHDAAALIGPLLADDPPFADRREVIASGPVLGAVLVAEIDLVALEGLEQDLRVLEIFVTDLVEIIHAEMYRKLLGPMVLDA